MIRFVDEAECRRYRADCSAVLKSVCTRLKGKGITAQFTLIGSGARNMVTRNGDGPFDLDYNLEIVKAPDEYWRDLRRLKDIVRIFLDDAAGLKCFSESKDSTSCLTAQLHFVDVPAVEFSFDVAIVSRSSGGTWRRLIHNKNAWGPGRDQYVWNEVAHSHDVAVKARKIKEAGRWLEVRDQYIKLKEQHLSGLWGSDHPSFVVYVEAVNNVYHTHFI